MKYPLPKNTIGSRYGVTERRSQPHRGLDFPAKTGSWITSPAGGTIVMNTWSDCLGWVLVLRFWHPSKKRAMYLGFSHLQNKSSHKVGDRIEEGNGRFARVGNTGSCSRGAHLHLTYGDTVQHIFSGRTFDPESLLERFAS